MPAFLVSRLAACLMVVVVAKRRDAIESNVAASIQSAPKNEYGRVDLETATSVIQRFLSQEHGWRIERSSELLVSSVRAAERAGRGLSHGDVIKAIDAIEQAIAAQDAQWSSGVLSRCNSMKATLLNLSNSGTGRVPLGAFEAAGSAVDLHAAGALEIGSPTQARLLLANYLQLPEHCAVVSKHHSSCCANECDDVTSQLEARLQAPFAAPDRVLKVVSQVSSSTVQAPRQMPEQLASQLQNIASQNGGDVPLHGQAWAQWLHFAFPNECPLPKLGGDIGHQDAVLSRRLVTARGSTYTADYMLEEYVNGGPQAMLSKAATNWKGDFGRVLVICGLAFAVLRAAWERVKAAQITLSEVGQDAELKKSTKGTTK